MKALPSLSVLVANDAAEFPARALVDSGCSQSIISRRFVRDVKPFGSKVIAVDGSTVSCGEAFVEVRVDGQVVSLLCLVMDKLIPEFDVVLGMDAIKRLGGLRLHGDASLQFGLSAVGTKSLEIEDADFQASFDGNKWTVRWRWVSEEPNLANKVACYGVDSEIKADFDREVESWVQEGILVPVPEGEAVSSVIPLMAVKQANKQKVRPVLDFKQLNSFVSSHTGSSAICDDTIRRWRKIGDNVALLDLRKAYLQLHVDRSLWRHQVVKFKGRHYYLTRLGFGINCAPRIMSRILGEVLKLDEKVHRATDNYLDDIIVNQDIATAEVVSRHLLSFGLVTKPAEALCDGARVLGLWVKRSSDGKLVWRRASQVPSLPDSGRISRRDLFSICGQLVAHHPVAGWLRVACGYIKRVSDGRAWEDDVGQRAREMLSEVVAEVQRSDPVGGPWRVTSERGTVWCDASSLAVGCALEIDGGIVEDGTWLRKEDSTHINLAELDAVVRGLNLAAKWGLKEVEVVTDSATVLGWLRSALFESHVVKTRGMSEMLVRRRLAVVQEICDGYGMTATVTWIESCRNKADRLTRVSKKWLQAPASSSECCCAAVEEESAAVRQIHERAHFGVNRTLYLVRLSHPSVSRDLVTKVVKSCSRCNSIDPAPVQWEKGELGVEESWSRIAIDVTHYGGCCYLTVVDCGPSRFAIWRRLRDESINSILSELSQIFRERGPPREILMDNALSFRSKAMGDLLAIWGVLPIYRCAYRPEGNAIVERNHRTIKRMAARSNGDPLMMVFWYNVTPKDGTRDDSLPCGILHQYRWLLPGVSPEEDKLEQVNGIRRGEKVFLKPPGATCTSTWSVGVVTNILSGQRLEVNGVPRHVSDVRRVPCDDAGGHASSDVEGGVQETMRRPQRVRRRPNFYGNNLYDV